MSNFQLASHRASDKKKMVNLKFIWDCYGTIKVQCSANQPKSTYQFLYHESLGVICRIQNKRDSIFGASNREPMIQKLPKYGMRDPHMM
jgi:hypothetical protein